jgi:hypothetical protein
MIEEVIRKFLSYSSSFVHRNGEAEEFSSSSFFFFTPSKSISNGFFIIFLKYKDQNYFFAS